MSTKTPAQAAEEKYPPGGSPDAVIGITIDQIARLAFIAGAEWQASQQRGPSLGQIIEVVERWRWKPGTTSLTAMEDLRDRLSKLLPQ